MSDHQSQQNNPSVQSDNHFSMSRPVPPTLLRIYADNQDKRSLCIFWAVFFITLIVMTALSAALPEQLLYVKNALQFNQTELQNCTNTALFIDGQLRCGDNDTQNFGLSFLNMDPQNQFGLLIIQIYLKDINLKSQITELATLKYNTIERATRDNDQVYYRRVDQTDSQQRNITFHSEEATKIYSDDNQNVIGYSYPVFVIRQFQKKSYTLIVSLSQPLANIDNVLKAQVSGLTVNPQFTVYTIVIRYFFFVWSIVAAAVYFLRFRKIPKNYKIPEQKMVFVLSILLIFFNDPVYPATVLTGSKGASYFSVFFMINFVIYLLFFWIFFLDRIFFEDGQKKTELINWKRILYILVTYLLTLVLYTQYAFDNIQDLPIVPAQDLISTKFLVLQIFCLVLVMAGFLYIFVQYARICTQVDSKLWRNQLLMFFSIFFILVTIVMFFVNGFHVFTYTGSRILLLYTQMNMYTYYMQYMYSITPQQRERIARGQLIQINDNNLYEGNDGLLGAVSQKDCIDLQFSDMPSGIMDGSINNKNRNKSRNKNESWNDDSNNKKWGSFDNNKGQRQLRTNEKLASSLSSDDQEQRGKYGGKQGSRDRDSNQNVDFFKQQKSRQNRQSMQNKNNKQKGEYKEQSDFGDFDLE